MAHDTGPQASGTPLTASIVTVLPVPRQTNLTPEQIRGATCVWCSEPLTAAAVDLGRRSGSFMGVVGHWSPRACDGCTRREAGRVLAIHDRTCARCSRRPAAYCPDGTALRGLAYGEQR